MNFSASRPLTGEKPQSLEPSFLCLTPKKNGGRIKKKQKGERTMGWKNQVIYQLKGYVLASYGGGAPFFG